MENEDELDIDLLKENYSEFQKKHGLPEFDELNRDFFIEKIENPETEFLLKEIRRFMMEKLSNYLRFVETVLNPMNASMFIFSFIKTLSQEDKKLLEEICKKLMKIEASSIETDVVYSEEKEASFVKESYVVWKEIQKDLLMIMNSVKTNWDNKTEKNGKGYFG